MAADLLHTAPTRCRKGNDGFSLKVIGFQKCVDDGWCHIPPDREPHQNRIIVSHVVPLRCDCWARMGIIHFNAASGSVIPPVKIRSCVRDSRFDLEDISADRLRQSFGNFGSRPGT